MRHVDRALDPAATDDFVPVVQDRRLAGCRRPDRHVRGDLPATVRKGRHERRDQRRSPRGPCPGVSLEPSLVLSVLVGIFHTALSVVIRGSAGGRLPLIVVAAILGAWAGDALMDRLGIDVLTIGDYHLIGASVLAWVGIAIVSAVAVLGPATERRT